uniref:type II toxin-antitoxin system VapC family toxin n=1 Tax=Endozoicomonas sp. ONNA2 TaxID=2828741 RepID=UPI002148376F
AKYPIIGMIVRPILSPWLEKRNEINTATAEGFLAQLENLPIYVDPLTTNQAFNRIATLARSYQLSSYDAAYLELAIRENLPLATLDKILHKAALKAGIPIYLMDSDVQ